MNKGNTTIKFNNKSKNRDFNIYTEEYFGGSDVFIYVNGKRVHNIAHIQFAIQEKHKPIYGYGSRTFDDVAVGDRIVIGAMKIPVANTDQSAIPNKRSSYAVGYNYQTDSAPNWVYNVFNSNDDNTGNKITSYSSMHKERNTVIYNVQKFLNTNLTGVLDFDTRYKMSKARDTFGLSRSISIDEELIDVMLNETVYAESVGEIYLYADPKATIKIKIIPPSSRMTIIANNGDVLYIRLSKSQTGFVKFTEVNII